MFQVQSSPVPCRLLVSQFIETKGPTASRTLQFEGVGDADVYNITAPFDCGGRTYLAGRVEGRHTELSQVRLFAESGPDRWSVLDPGPVWHQFQDPFVFRLGSELVLGGVQVISDPLQPERIVSWRTLFYKGMDPLHLTLWVSGPEKMKDIRMVALTDGRVGVFTRPQGGSSGMGQIGFRIAESPEVLTASWIAAAPTVDSHFVPGEWGGPNEVHRLSDGTLGVLGHIAYFDEQGDRHYQAMAYRHDPETGTHGPVRILACRRDFGPGPAKRPDLVDVVFSGGLRRLPGGKAELWAGISDAGAQVLTVDDPWEGL